MPHSLKPAVLKQVKAALIVHCLCGFAPSTTASAQSQVRADNCSVAVHGNISNSNIAPCAGRPDASIGAAEQLREILSHHEFDPELLRLLNRRDYDLALRRIEAVAAANPSQARHYFSLAGGIQALRGNLVGALDYSRRAYEEAPNDVIFLSRYTAALWVAGRVAEALELQNASHRRRAQFGEWGRLVLELSVAIHSYSDSWTSSSRICATDASGNPAPSSPDGIPLREHNRALDNPIGTCPLDQDTTRAVRAFRNRVADAGMSLQRLPTQNVNTLNMRHVAAQFVLLADVLLRDTSAANTSMADLQHVDEELLLVGGPWAFLNSVAALTNIDLLLPPEFSRTKYEMYDQALRDAALVPPISFDPSDLSNRAIGGFSRMMLGSYRAFRAMIMARHREHAGAWVQAQAAAQTLRNEDDSALTIAIRLINLHALVEAGNSMPEDAERSAFIDAEFNSIVDRFRRNPNYLAPYGGYLLVIGADACATRRLTRASCRRSLIPEHLRRRSPR